jgi:hypothetical protein
MARNLVLKSAEDWNVYDRAEKVSGIGVLLSVLHQGVNQARGYVDRQVVGALRQ